MRPDVNSWHVNSTLCVRVSSGNSTELWFRSASVQCSWMLHRVAEELNWLEWFARQNKGKEYESTSMQAVELPSAYDIATRGTFPASYAGRPSSYSPHSRTNRTRSSTSSNMYATTRKGSAPGASRGSPRTSPQKRAATNSAAVKKPSEEQGARSSLQPTARSSNKSSTTASSSTTAQQPGAGGHSYPKSPRHNSNSSSKHQQQQG